MCSSRSVADMVYITTSYFTLNNPLFGHDTQKPESVLEFLLMVKKSYAPGMQSAMNMDHGIK